MVYLALASLMWAFSFGLIGQHLGNLDSQSVAFVRLIISLAVFIPFLRWGYAWRHMLRLMAIGAVQYGVMYAVYIEAYQSLRGHEVALFTILTPLFVTLFDDWRRRRFQRVYFLAALLAVVGGVILTGLQPLESGMLPGILMIQVANLCFAAGQVEYKCWAKQYPLLARRSWHHFAYLYVGAVLASGVFASVNGLSSFRPSSTQWWVLLYLGVVPSALGFYFWNIGSHRVNAGTLAVFNNVKIPLALAVSLLFFGETASLPRLITSAAVIAAGFAITIGLRSRRSRPRTAPPIPTTRRANASGQ